MGHPIFLTAALAFLAASLEAQLAQPPAGITEGVLADPADLCPANPAFGSLESSPSWSGWGGGANNARYQAAANSGITDGAILWRTQLWETQKPSGKGLVVWGGASDGRRVYYPLQQPGGGLKALDIKTGKVEWNAAIKGDQRGQAGPARAMPGIVFTGGWDGILGAVDAGGSVVWSFNAVRDFVTVNGIAAKGGSFGSAGPVIVDGMVFAASGYPGTMRGTQGNVFARIRRAVRIAWSPCRTQTIDSNV